MTAIAASACQLALRATTSPYPYVPLKGVDRLDYTLQHEAAASPHLGDEGWRVHASESRISQLSIRAAGVANSYDADSQLRTAAILRSPCKFSLALGDGASLSGDFVVLEYGYQSAPEGLARFNLSLASSGALTFTPAP